MVWQYFGICAPDTCNDNEMSAYTYGFNLSQLFKYFVKWYLFCTLFAVLGLITGEIPKKNLVSYVTQCHRSRTDEIPNDPWFIGVMLVC